MSNIKKYVHKTTLPNGTFVNNTTLCTVEYSDKSELFCQICINT